MDHKFEGAGGKYRNQDMRSEFYQLVTLDRTVSDSVLWLTFLKCMGEKPEVKLTGLGLSEYCQPKPVFLGQISISIIVISHYLIISDENRSCCLQCLKHLLSNSCVPGSVLSIHGEASECS